MSPIIDCEQALEEAAEACERSMWLLDKIDRLTEEYNDLLWGDSGARMVEEGEDWWAAVHEKLDDIHTYEEEADIAWDECQYESWRWVKCCGGTDPGPEPPKPSTSPFDDTGPIEPLNGYGEEEVYPA